MVLLLQCRCAFIDYTILLLLFLGFASQRTAAQDCTDLSFRLGIPIFVDENSPIGTILFDFQSDGDWILTIDNAIFDGYLRLEKDDSASPLPNYNIVQSQTLDYEFISLTTNTRTARADLVFQLICTPASAGVRRQVPGRVAVANLDDNPPEFINTTLVYYVDEGRSVGSTVFSLENEAFDLDQGSGGQMLYGISAVKPPGDDHFHIGRSAVDGNVLVSRALDYDAGPKVYIYHATATGLDGDPNTATATLTIIIQDIDDLPPSFQSPVVTLNIQEENDTLVGMSLQCTPPLLALDQDKDINASVVYTIVTVVPDTDIFSVIRNADGSAGFQINRTLDRETIAFYNLNVKACQENVQSKCDFSFVMVTIVDINDNTPEMSTSVYNASLMENSPADSLVLNVFASDHDIEFNRIFEFDLVDPSNNFKINPRTGEIRVNTGASLDREITPQLNFHVFARETESQELKESTRSSVTITLLDMNDNTPQFVRQNYTFTIDELADIDTPVGHVHAEDLDVSLNGDVTYSIQYDAPVSRRFTINQTSGEITVSGDLSETFHNQYILSVRAQDLAIAETQRRQSSVLVYITVRDSNNHVPEFESASYSFNISEAVLTDSLVTTLMMSDADVDDSLNCSLVSGDSNGHFTVRTIADSCWLSVYKELDREIINEYNLILHVSDGTKTSTAMVRIIISDENDNHPVFSQSTYNLTIMENAPVGTALTTILAEDNDLGANGQVNYRVPAHWSQYFAIDPASGNLTTTAILDRESMERVNFVIEAYDRGDPSLSSIVPVLVLIEDTNDNAPYFDFPSVTITVEDGTTPIDLYTVKAHDLDSSAVNREMTYQIIRGDENVFSVDQSSGGISARRRLNLEDATHRGWYSVVVQATNTLQYANDSLVDAHLTVNITILDRNTEQPVFLNRSYSFLVPEDQPVDSTVGRIEAIDKDTSHGFQKVHYEISAGNDAGVFDITDAGEIILKIQIDRDDPSSQIEYNITVLATDPSLSSTLSDETSVIIKVIDVNDNSPKFEQDTYEWSIEENQASVTFSVIATDRDSGENAHITYSITRDDLPVIINPDSGVLSLKNALDFENTSLYYPILVIAKDNGKPSRESVAILKLQVTNINDNAPMFLNLHYNFSFLESAPVGTIISREEAVDADGDTLHYSFISSHPSLRIDATNGEISTTRALDFETEQILNVVISVTDGTHSATAQLTVFVTDLNDNSPVFARTAYNVGVQENRVQPLIQLNATDEDSGANGDITYALVSDDVTGQFLLENISGQLILRKSLDFESQNVYTLSIQAVDGGSPRRTGFTVVTVTVTDEDDQWPVFSPMDTYLALPEDANNGTVVTEVSVYDSDTNSSNLVYSVVNSDLFGFNGNLLLKSGLLDADPGPSYTGSLITLNISVSDGERQTFTLLNITVIDANDNSPKFQGSMKAVISETIGFPRHIYLVSVTDRDISNDGFTYWLRNGEGKFDIDSMNGTVYVTQQLKSQEQSHYILQVFVSDHGRPPRIVSANLTIEVNNSNNYPPEFLNATYSISLTENHKNGPVLKLDAYDGDPGRMASFIRYGIASGNEAGKFHLNGTTGLLSLNGTLDYDNDDAIREFTLLVTAEDNGITALTGTAIVNINVTDVNDNKPVFSPEFALTYTLTDDTPAKTVIIQVLASDIDSGANSELTFSMTIENSTVDSDTLFIDENSGDVKTNDTLHPFINQSLVLRITVQDKGIPSHSVSTDVTLLIINRILPVFHQTPYEVSVSENHPAHLLLDVNATIGDLQVDVGLIYSFIAKNATHKYVLEPFTGRLFTSKPLDREQSPTGYDRLIIAAHVMSGNEPDETNVTYTQVTVFIIDVNDVAPEFLKSQYSIKVSEDTHVGESVITLTALDPDLNSMIEYSIVVDDSAHSFHINSTNGMVTIAKGLDYDTMPASNYATYQLLIMASDGVHSTNTTLEVHVTDVNDQAPLFRNHTLNVTIQENVAGVTIATVIADDTDTMDQNQLRYRILRGNDDESFALSPTSGVVSIVKALDYEKADTRSLIITVTDSGELHNDTMMITVQVTNQNDNGPVFSQELYTASTLEGNESLSLTVQLKAVDNDAGADRALEFYIVADPYEATRVDYQGLLTVTMPLDRETMGTVQRNGTSLYRIIVGVRDDGQVQQSATASVYILIDDVNDNPPEFDQKSGYFIQLAESTPLNSTILSFTTTDQDYKPEYRKALIVIEPESNPNRTFDMETLGDKGYIHIRKPVDVHTMRVYNLTLRAQDEAAILNTYSWVYITVIDTNNENPVFTQALYTFHIEEHMGNATYRKLVGSVSATDADEENNGQFTFSLEANVGNIFEIIQRDINVGDIFTAGNVDHERQDQYLIRVVAEDHGMPSRTGYADVKIVVEDLNDNAPQFTPMLSSAYNGTIVEGSTDGTNVILDNSIFAFDVDKDLNSEIQFIISGTNSSLFVAKSVLVHKQYQAEISVTTSDPMSLDYERQQQYNLELTAVDQIDTRLRSEPVPLVIDVININDNRPIFTSSNYTFYVSENVSISNGHVGFVIATDRDLGEFGEVVYYGQASGDNSKFYVDSRTGEIRLLTRVDREAQHIYSFNISARDSGNEETITSVTVEILDVDDNVPEFNQTLYKFCVVEERSNAVVGTVLADDPDEGRNAQFNYSLSDLVNFTIDAYGIIRTLQSLDREQRSTYQLTALALSLNDSILSSAAVIVELEDINDNTPHIQRPENGLEAIIVEKSPLMSVVTVIQGFDPDAALNGVMTFNLTGPASELFSIDTMNDDMAYIRVAGRIEINSLILNGYIDSVSERKLHLVVTVMDSGTPPRGSNASLSVAIGGLSAVAISFQQVSYPFSVAENLNAVHPVGNLTAMVANSTRNVQLSYLIKDNAAASDVFSVTGTAESAELDGFILYTAEISTRISLDYEMKQTYTFVVQATDGRVPEQTAYTVVTIHIQDMNDHSPVCENSPYHITIPENNNDNASYGTLKVIDRDSGDNADISFTILSGDPDNEFLIRNVMEDNIYTQRALDRESTSQYNIAVLAEDNGSPRRNCTAQLVVSVADINDKAPSFYNFTSNMQNYIVNISEDKQPGEQISQVYAKDLDTGVNGQIYFRLTPQPSLKFYIDPHTGIIKLLSLLDYESQQVYTITVNVYDGGTPPLSAKSLVTVYVMDIYEPEDWKPPMVVYVDEDSKLDIPIAKVAAQGEGLFFRITAGNDESVFTIGALNGEISLALKPLLSSSPYNLTVISTKNREIQSKTQVLVYVRDERISVFSVMFGENRDPDSLVIDLNAADELLRDVRYSFTNHTQTEHGDKFRLTRNTGELYCLVSLDRESTSEYELQVVYSVTSTQRRKRAFGAEPGQILIRITIEDENDNSPIFNVRNDHLIIGIPGDEGYGYLVTTLKAYDADSGNNSAIVYSITSGDSASLHIDSITGDLFTSITVADSGLTRYEVQVTATDNGGVGLTDTVTVTALVVPDNDRAVLVTDIPPSVVNEIIPALTSNLSAILGFDVGIVKVKPHRTDSGAVDFDKSDLYMHAIDLETGTLVNKQTLLRRLAEKDKDIRELFRLFGIEELKDVYLPLEPYVISEAEIALIVLATIIFVGSLVCIGAHFYIWKQHKAELLRVELAQKVRANLEGAINPAYVDTSIDADGEELVQFDCYAVEMFELFGLPHAARFGDRIYPSEYQRDFILRNKRFSSADAEDGLVIMNGSVDTKERRDKRYHHATTNGTSVNPMLSAHSCDSVMYESQELSVDILSERSEATEAGSIREPQHFSRVYVSIDDIVFPDLLEELIPVTNLDTGYMIDSEETFDERSVSNQELAKEREDGEGSSGVQTPPKETLLDLTSAERNSLNDRSKGTVHRNSSLNELEMEMGLGGGGNITNKFIKPSLKKSNEDVNHIPFKDTCKYSNKSNHILPFRTDQVSLISNEKIDFIDQAENKPPVSTEKMNGVPHLLSRRRLSSGKLELPYEEASTRL